jgi:hypothetical protein
MRERHTQAGLSGWCVECFQPWPCDALVLLDGLQRLDKAAQLLWDEARARYSSPESTLGAFLAELGWPGHE